ncbi:1,4-alpha-glucan branching protein GlgB [Paenibacillus athensensis]|uniref:1,4-alpha-glucan branching enzyme GlgB n=1 Tax=Paenibacillus athensensis TaxID=1967502 RepID=A0A4Y8PYJ1_9BACL|nr:1,4-alpha-glucan branching protein GlgB [Paenibacillus athensensis]MCD1261213.1 1,4-alpha-glucan branching protein GlgB [Paenibacillus athensensis]
MTTAAAASADDLYLLHEGTQYQSYRFLGSHVTQRDGQSGVHFAVWAPNAKQVNVTGSFNGWDGSQHAMQRRDGIWTLFIEGLSEGELYKYEIVTADDEIYLKADPYAFHSELRPGTASIVTSLEGYEWNDDQWHATKTENQFLQQPLLIYEVHLGSWKRKEDGGFYTYVELADELVSYVKERGYTHIELLPLEEHPLDASWGYQVTGYYSVTSRFGSPKDFMYFVDRCHQEGIGVIMDWVPAHFCKDDHGLTRFDGTPLYEYADPRKGEHATWGTQVFDYSKPEVLSYLISNALFWMDIYRVDGLRVDAVYSILTLNFDRAPEDCIQNEMGGDENLEGIAFLQKLNAVVFSRYPNALMMAEDSSDYPGVTTPVDQGGLGFNYKWNMGWSCRTLEYMKTPEEERIDREADLTDSFSRAWDENYVLPYSHDETANGTKSLLGKMSGTDNWQRFANLRVLYSYMMGHPGKKLLFMGTEFGQMDDWNAEGSLEWELLNYEEHRQFQTFVQEVNRFYLAEKALWEMDHDPAGFEPIGADDTSDGLVQFVRKAADGEEFLIIVCNFRSQPREGYRLGVNEPGTYYEAFNSDGPAFGGTGVCNEGPLEAEEWHCQGRPYSVSLTIPPLGAVMLKRQSEKG